MSAALDGRRVLVTGGSSGIGAATARAAAGAGVAVLGRDTERVAAVDGAVHGLGGLEAMVHAAGTMVAGSVADTVRVSTIAPGFVRTPLADRLPEGVLREFYRARLAQVGLDPEVLADAVVHLLAQPPGVTVVEYTLVPTVQ